MGSGANKDLLKGISGLHSWIKTQNMLRPGQTRKRMSLKSLHSMGDDEDDEDVVISLTSGDPNTPAGRVR